MLLPSQATKVIFSTVGVCPTKRDEDSQISKSLRHGMLKVPVEQGWKRLYFLPKRFNILSHWMSIGTRKERRPTSETIHVYPCTWDC